MPDFNDDELPADTTGGAPRNQAEVLAIFDHYLAGKIDPQDMAVVLPFAMGATPATIQGWVSTARSRARLADRGLELGDILAAIVPKDTRSVEELEAVAVHEAGHAVVAEVLGIGVVSVSIVASGFAGGVTQIKPPPETFNRAELEDLVTFYLSGRAADMVVGRKGPHSGASIDLEMATAALTRGMCEWGLYDTLVHTDPDSGDVFDIVHKRLKRLFNRAVRIVTRHRSAVVDLAGALVRQRLLTGQQVAEVLAESAAKIDRALTRADRPNKSLMLRCRRITTTVRIGSNAK